jgi:DNA-binding transcriptional MocR family regulator
LPSAVGSDHGLHVWLPLPPGMGPDRLRFIARERGLALVTAEAFAATPDHANGVRISLGGPAKRAVLSRALAGVADIVAGTPTPASLVV